MSDHFYKDILYPLQDKVLSQVAKNETPFYLTGGTALSRFMLNHRYSDDLDFFANRVTNFSSHVITFHKNLEGHFEKVVIENTQESYARIMVYTSNAELKIELVSDVGFRVGLPDVSASGFKIDTWGNILSNKLTALQRKAGKDFVDILHICLNYQFNWETIVDYAKQKDAWINEIRVSEYLNGFNPQQLNEVKFSKDFDPFRIKEDFFKVIARDSLHGFNNSLYGTKL